MWVYWNQQPDKRFVFLLNECYVPAVLIYGLATLASCLLFHLSLSVSPSGLQTDSMSPGDGALKTPNTRPEDGGRLFNPPSPHPEGEEEKREA